MPDMGLGICIGDLEIFSEDREVVLEERRAWRESR